MNSKNIQSDILTPNDEPYTKTEEEKQINANCSNVYNINDHMNIVENNYNYMDKNINESGLFYFTDPILKLKNQNLIKISLNSKISPEILNINKFMIFLILLSLIPFIIFHIFIFWIILVIFYFIIYELIVVKKYIYLYFNLDTKIIYIFKNKQIVNQFPISYISDFHVDKKRIATYFYLNIINQQPILLFILYTKNYIERIEEEDILNNWLDYLRNYQ